MAENKESFILYCDLIHTVKKMPKDKVAELFIHILEYVNDLNPQTDDLILNLVFEPIKQQLKRDLRKWENVCNRNKINGIKGGRPKNPKEPKKPSGLIENPKNPVAPDNDNDSDNDNDNDNDNDIISINTEKIENLNLHNYILGGIEDWDNLTDEQKNKYSNLMYEELINSHSWITDFVRFKKISETKIKNELKDFCVNQKLSGDIKRGMKELKKHFTNIINKKIKELV